MRVTALLTVLSTLVLAGTAQAESYRVTVGGRVRLRPPYEGSDNYRLVPIPLISVRKVGALNRFIPPDGSATLGLVDTRHIVMGPVLRLREHRPDTGKFVGLQDIGVAVEPGTFVDLWPVDWLRLHLEGRRGVAGHSGWVGDAGLDVIHTGQKWDFSIGPRIGFGDRHYMQTYFGVTALEAARNPTITRAYLPGGGQRYTGGTIAGAYHLDKRWRTTLDISYNRLSSIAQQSPVVQRLGARNQFSVGAGVSYTFGRVG